MANRRLNDEERAHLALLQVELRKKLRALASNDETLYWAMRRRLWVQLQFEERGTPAHRAKLKQVKRNEQGGKCNLCDAQLDERFVILDRHEAMKGYSAENTQLLCRLCDYQKQEANDYR